MSKFSIQIVFCFVLLFAFNSSLLASDGDVAKNGKIRGAVIDNSTNEGVEYASVVLYNWSDNEMVSGTISDFNGDFKIDNILLGTYYLKISFIGFEEMIVDTFTLNEDKRSVNFGNIFLRSLAKELEEFEVVGKKAAVEYRIDKKIINVDKQITAEGGNAVDVLENVPSIQVDVEGNVMLRGSTGFTVLIDGNPTILEPSDILRQMPSSSIENIEIITNPSVKYDPDGATGIINIITKKSKLKGVSGIVNANVGRFEQYGGDFQLNYRMNDFNFIIGANYSKRTRPADIYNNRVTLEGDTTINVDAYGESDRGRTNGSVTGGIEYTVSKNDFLSLSGTFGEWNMSNYSELRYDNYRLPEDSSFSYLSNDNVTRGGGYYSVIGVYRHSFSKKKEAENLKPKRENGSPEKAREGRPGFKSKVDHSIIFDINYQNREIDEESQSEILSLENELRGATKNTEYGPSQTIRINAEYTLPIGKEDKFEAGMRLRSGESLDETELYTFVADSGDVVLQPQFSNTTNYFRNIYSAYGLYAGIYKKFGYQVGLRTEYTDRKVEVKNDSPFKLNRWDVFPTIHISYELPKEQQMMLSYSRRIDRPRGYWLEPFITWQDVYNVRQGNPGLKPEYIDSFDFSYVKKFKNNYLSIEGYYRVTNNKVERIQSIYTKNVLLTKPENVGEDYSLGLEAMVNLTVTDWWDMDFGANLFNYRLKGEVVYTDIDDVRVESLDRSNTTWNGRFNNTFSLWENGVLQVNSRYNSKSITAQGTRSGYYNLDAAFKISMLKKSLSFNLQGRNLLGTTVRESYVEGLDFSSYYKLEPRFPMITLSISYRFNNFRQSRGSNQNGSGDDF